MVASAWCQGFRAAIAVQILTMLVVTFGPAAWKSGVAFYEGRIATFSGLDARDTAKTIDGDPLSTFHSHTNQLGFASYSYSPMAGAFSLFFGTKTGSDAHIDRAELTCTGGTRVPFNVDSPPFADLVAAPTGCRFLNFTITDGTGGMLDDYFDLARLPGGAES